MKRDGGVSILCLTKPRLYSNLLATLAVSGPWQVAIPARSRKRPPTKSGKNIRSDFSLRTNNRAVMVVVAAWGGLN